MYFSYVSRGNYVADVCLVYAAALKKLHMRALHYRTTYIMVMLA